MKPALKWLIYPVSLYERKLFFLLLVGTNKKLVVNMYLSGDVFIHSFTHSFLKNNKQNIINQNQSHQTYMYKAHFSSKG